jgi:ornithine cyclodeaminase
MSIHISDEDVMAALDADTAIRLTEEAYAAHAENRIAAPPRLSAAIPGSLNSFIVLPAIPLDHPYFGYKFASSFPGNTNLGLPTVTSHIALYSMETGVPVAQVESNYLTTLKTGASAAVATRYLAREDASVMAVIGAGELSKHVASCLSRVRRLKELRIYDRDPSKSEALADWLKDHVASTFEIMIAPDGEACVAAADIVATCTTSPVPVLKGGHVADGCHINAMGSFTPDMQEIDARTVERCSKIVVDVVADAWAHAGDLIRPLEAGIIGRDAVYGTLGGIVSGALPGRTDPREITLFESIGFGVLDVALAIAAYEACGRRRI